MNTKKLGLFVPALLLGTVALTPSEGYAVDTNSQIGEGIIEYKQDNIPDVVITPPGTEEPQIDNPKPNPNKGLMMIMGITPVDFGLQEVTTAETNYYAADFETVETADPTNAQIMENFVKFRDLRAVEKHDYTVSAQLTKQFTYGTSVLKGAKLEYKNLRLKTTPENETAGNKPVVGVDATLAASVPLAPDVDGVAAGTSVQVLEVTAGNNKGFGVYDIVFGERGAGTEAEDSSKSVQLTVPGNLAVVAGGEYKAEITWTIAETPGRVE